MNETDITILKLSEALAKIADLDALCTQQTRTINLTAERAAKAEAKLDDLQRTAVDVYEERIREIADDVIGLVPRDTPTIVLLGAIERKCGEERIGRLAAERARDEVGIQLAAAQERLRLAMAVVEAARWVRNYYRDGLGMPGPMGHLGQALAALDAVPGDALATCKPDLQVGAPFDEPGKRRG
jgi:hypothetical protein